MEWVLDYLISDKALIRATSNAVIELKNSECAIKAGKLTINGTDLIDAINKIDTALEDFKDLVPDWIFDYESSPIPPATES